MRRLFNEWWSTQRAKNPGGVVIGVILLFNLVFLLVAAAVISALSLDGTEHMGFLEAAFCTITMILDAGCIQFVISDIGQSGVFISVFCLMVVLIGMISFTGSVIGYVTNYISNFIENANAGKQKIFISNHIVILNWNTRASEIINDLLYSENKQKVVVLVGSRKDEIKREIEERLADTIARENIAVTKRYAHLGLVARKRAIRKNRFRNNLSIMVREGDVFSTKQLQDISLDRARSIIILGNDINNTICKFEQRERKDASGRGNSQTVKTLMQVVDITSATSSNDNQKIVVEITDDWTWDLVHRIIKSKQVEGKCDVVPIRVHQVLGQILSQFSLMPELNIVYEELFSNRGAEFYTVRHPEEEDFVTYAKEYCMSHKRAIPLTFMQYHNEQFAYYTAEQDTDVFIKSYMPENPDFTVKLNHNYWLEPKTVVMLGHNSKCRDIMQGFKSFYGEWSREGEEILRIVVIDDKNSLEKLNYYKEYPFVVETVAADIYDEELICSTIERVIDSHDEDTSILILSDDMVLNEDIDANVLANLIYVHEIIAKRQQQPGFDPGSIDVVVEIIDPKHHDIVNSYSVNNVVISNRYISKMIAQIGEVDALFDFYTDILSYDEEDGDSKEIYIKKASTFFDQLPGRSTAHQLVRAVLEASVDENLPKEEQAPSMVLGYVKPDGSVHLFSGNLADITVELGQKDKLIIFSSH